MNPQTNTAAPPDRGPTALFAASRCIGEAVHADIIGDQVERTRQLEQADALLAEAGRVGALFLDEQLGAAVERAQAMLAAVRGGAR